MILTLLDVRLVVALRMKNTSKNNEIYFKEYSLVAVVVDVVVVEAKFKYWRNEYLRNILLVNIIDRPQEFVHAIWKIVSS